MAHNMMFSDPETQLRFETQFAHLEVAPGGVVQMDDFQYIGGFQQIFQEQHWLPFLALDEPIYPDLVRSFFCSIRWGNVSTGDAIYGTIRGTEYKIDERMLAQITNAPRGGMKLRFRGRWWLECGAQLDQVLPFMFSGNSARAQDLKGNLRMVYGLLTLLITPKRGNLDELQFQDIQLLYLLASFRLVDLNKVIYQHIGQCALNRDPNKLLPYGSVFTRLFRMWGIDLAREQALPPRGAITHEAIENLGFTMSRAERLNCLIQDYNEVVQEHRNITDREEADVPGNSAPPSDDSNDEL